MTKTDAKKLFGRKISDEEFGKIMGRNRTTITMWGDNLSNDQARMVLGVAWSFGIDIPKKYKIKRRMIPECVTAG